MSDWTMRHRGPYRLLVSRRTTSTKVPVRSEWLKGAVEAEDVQHEAEAVLKDPRDSIVSVDVWSTREQMFVMTFMGEEAGV